MVKRSVINLDIQLVHAVHLENACGWASTEKGEVVRSGVQRELPSIESPLDRGKSEIRDETVRNARLYNRRRHRILRLYLHAVKKLKAPQFYARRSQVFEVHERLLEEAACIVDLISVRGVIGTSESKLSERRGSHRVVRQSEDRGTLALDKPVHAFAGLTDADAKQRIEEWIRTVASVPFEPV